MLGGRVARVLIDSPLPQLDRLFDYAVPVELADEAEPGVRVRVPLRSMGRLVSGYIVSVAGPEDSDRPLSEIESVLSPARVLPAELYDLARRVADRAAGSASDILRLVVPKRMVRAERAWLARGAGPGPELPAADVGAQALDGYPGLAERIEAGGRTALDAIPRTTTLPDGTTVGEWAVLLAAAAARTLARGRSALLAVPDYRDRRQLEAALRSLVSDDLVIRDDAQQPAAERYAGYLRRLEAHPCIVVGSRSTVYSPAYRTGLVAVWDDGDTLFDEPLAPGVHARDAALVRQELEGSALLFAGHTRSTDLQRLIDVGWVDELQPLRRVTPRVVLSATREGEGRSARVPSAAFEAARRALEHGPVLVQVSRPGYAPALVCAECRRPARCAHCTGPLRASRPGAAPDCVWCGRTAHHWRCPHCESERWRMASSGSERTADELGRAFPMARVIVSDGAHPVETVDGRPALVVATRGAEPLAPGGYRAVLLLDADRMLMGESLRVAEDCLRWWSNAAALAAPDSPVHLVGVTGGVARALATWTQSAFARSELVERAALRMPPAVRVAALTGPRGAVDAALAGVRADVPGIASDAVLGPIDLSDAAGGTRALLRFDYAQGRAVAESLRAAVVADAMSARRAVKGRRAPARNTLRVRVDVPDLDL